MQSDRMYPPLPRPKRRPEHWEHAFTAEDMRAYVDADRASSEAVRPMSAGLDVQKTAPVPVSPDSTQQAAQVPVAGPAGIALTDDDHMALSRAFDALKAIADRNEIIDGCIEPVSTITQAQRKAAHAMKSFGPLFHRLDRAALALHPSAAPATEPWVLLSRKDIVQAGDEMLDDDCTTWVPVNRIPIGFPYYPGAHVPMRRRTTPTPGADHE